MAVKPWNIFAAALLVGVLVIPSLGQTAPGTPGQQPNPNTPPGGGRQRRQYDPAQARQQSLDRVKQALGATDDEFQALAPKIDKVMTLQRDTRGGSSRRGRTRGGDPNAAPTPSATPTTPLTPARQASTDLAATLANKDAKPDEIKARLDAYRAARAQAKAELAAAQQDLLGLLTQRQEAMLVTLGILE
jgi:hypothetical protein